MLAAAGAKGRVGPNLDTAPPSVDEVVTVVTNGRDAMPSFRGQLSKEEIRSLAEYVSAEAGK